MANNSNTYVQILYNQMLPSILSCINQDQFWNSNAKVCVTYPINANVAIIISDSQQKYVVLKAMRRSGGISKILLMKKLK